MWRHGLSNKTATHFTIYWQQKKKMRGGKLNAAIAVSCQNSFRAPAAKLVYKLMH